MKDLLLPRTDRAAALQAVVAGAVLVSVFFLVRRDRDLRLFVAGVTVLAEAWFGLRAVH